MGIKKHKGILLMGICLLCIYIILTWNIQSKDEVEIHFIHLTIGECTLIKSKQGNILLGGGTKKDQKRILQYLQKMKISELEAVIVPKAQKEYAEALLQLLDEYKVKNLYFPQTEDIDPIGIELVEKAKEKGIGVYKLTGSEKWNLHKMTIEVLAPRVRSVVPEKNKMPVIFISHPKLKLLWISDASLMVKQELLLDKKRLKAHVLKVSGVQRGIFIEEDFLAVVNPSIILMADSLKAKEEEVRQAFSYQTNSKIISGAKEGNIIFYRRPTGYYITTERKMKIRIQ
jgi:competence protein ComEC